MRTAGMWSETQLGHVQFKTQTEAHLAASLPRWKAGPTAETTWLTPCHSCFVKLAGSVTLAASEGLVPGVRRAETKGVLGADLAALEGGPLSRHDLAHAPPQLLHEAARLNPLNHLLQRSCNREACSSQDKETHLRPSSLRWKVGPTADITWFTPCHSCSGGIGHIGRLLRQITHRNRTLEGRPHSGHDLAHALPELLRAAATGACGRCRATGAQSLILRQKHALGAILAALEGGPHSRDHLAHALPQLLREAAGVGHIGCLNRHAAPGTAEEILCLGRVAHCCHHRAVGLQQLQHK